MAQEPKFHLLYDIGGERFEVDESTFIPTDLRIMRTHSGDFRVEVHGLLRPEGVPSALSKITTKDGS